MASPPTSNVQFFRPDGSPIPEPREWEPAWVVVEGSPDDLKRAVLRKQEVVLPLRCQRIGDRLVLAADWPRSGCGTFRISLDAPNRFVHRTITIRPTKITEAAFGRLLDDLTFRLPAAIAWKLQGLGGLAGIRLRPPADCSFGQELFRLRRAIEGRPDVLGLTQILERLADAPHRILTTREEVVGIDRARRLHPSRFPAIVNAHQRVTLGHIGHVPDQRPIHEVDVPENRLVAAFCHQIQFRLRRLAAIARATPALEASRLEIEALERKTEKARRRAAFLDEVQLLDRPIGTPSMVLQRRPEYRSALLGLRELNQEPAIYLDTSALDAPLESLPVLYQAWGTLCVLDVMLDQALEAGWAVKTHDIVKKGPHGLVMQILRAGTTLLTLSNHAGTTIRLRAEPTYGLAGVLRSASFPQIPDVVVERETEGIWDAWIFDPKYKLQRINDEGDHKPKKEDIDKMHAYRDAIRDRDDRHIVRYASILYPGPSQQYGVGLEAIRAVPGDDGPLRERLAKVISQILALRQVDVR